MIEPQFQFRGVWTPADILFLFRDKKINSTEMTFLSLVDGLCEARGKGCWASNRYLAEFMGLHISSVKTIVGKLRGLGLITSSQDGGRRVLETAWSRPVPSPVLPRTVSGTPRLLRSNRLDNIIENGSFLSEGSEVATFKQSPKEEKATAADLVLADELQNTICDVMQIFRPWSRGKWATAFRLLRKDLKDDKTRLRRVFDWWRDNPKKKGLPSILNAEQFRRHFIWIEGACNKDIGKLIKIDEETKAIAKRVVMRGWPGQTRTLVPITIQTTKNNVGEFILHLQVFINNLRPGNDLYFAKHIKSKMGDPKHFTEQWMNMLHERYAKWKEWNGDLDGQAFNIDSPHFQKMGRGWATAYTSDPKRWDQLIKDIKGIRSCK